MNEFEIGEHVEATSKDGDFANNFMGVIVSKNNGFIQVRDQEDNVFDCDPDQLSHLP